MEEQTSDHATTDELRSYLADNLRMSALAWYHLDDGFDTERLDEGFVESLRTALRLGADGFIETLVEKLLASLVRLNTLPRDDEFWGGRNARPTIYKLRDFNAYIVQGDPKDVPALWAQAALYLLHGSTNFGPKQWKRLYLAGDFDVSWPIFAALITELNASETDEQLASLILRVEAVDEAKEILARFEAAGDPWIQNWSQRVLAGLDG